MSDVFNYLRLSEPYLNAVLASTTETRKLWHRLVENYHWNPPEDSDLGLADADTTWDAIHFVLDPERRAGRINSGSIAAHAVRGAKPFPGYLPFDGIGYTRPPRVHEIAEALAPVDILSLSLTLADELSQVRGSDFLYRAAEPKWIAYYFEPMRSLYLAASERSQAVLVFSS